ncbi:MAG: 6-phosphogluconolactonase [Gemmataceae bacterium]|nr:6-phosphogluconolactonase [Gemmataceae bacterium]MDW8265551.1 6-phosphogluconolactonase [Gemmataceae bacterium]
MTIQTCADLEGVSRAAAALFVTKAREAVADRGVFTVALSGGHTPLRTYQLLADPDVSEQVPWEQVHVFWGDERFVPTSDPRSNQRLARRAWLDHVPIPPSQIHPIPCTGTPREAAGRYEALLRTFFSGDPPRFDLVYLGLGENGHTASLFPETPVLTEQRRWVAEVYVPEEKLFRITLTAPCLNQAAVIAFLVSGVEKADIVREVIEGPRDPQRLPAQLIQPIDGELIWLIDQAAAAKLCRRW